MHLVIAFQVVNDWSLATTWGEWTKTDMEKKKKKEQTNNSITELVTSSAKLKQ